jgi:hypothetical protein
MTELDPRGGRAGASGAQDDGLAGGFAVELDNTS